MRVTPEGKLAEMLCERGRADLLKGFSVDEERLEHFKDQVETHYAHLGHEERLALAIYMAHFHVGQKTERPKHVFSGVTPTDWLTWAWRLAILVLLALILAMTARAQVPHDPILIQPQNAGTTLATRQSGVIRLNCSTGMSCSWGSNTFTMTAGAGSADTASNVGGGAFYWFYQKLASDFQFYSFDVTSPLQASLALNKITLSLQQADATYSGYLTSGDWGTFNGKLSGTVGATVGQIPYASALGVLSDTTSFSRLLGGLGNEIIEVYNPAVDATGISSLRVKMGVSQGPNAPFYITDNAGNAIFSLGSDGSFNTVLQHGHSFYNDAAQTSRWYMALGTIEGGGNTGSDFFLHRYSDAGAYLGAVFNIQRSTGYLGIGKWPLTALDVDGTVTGTAFAGPLIGNASTASALAADPTDCSVAGQYAHAIAANGNLTCSTPSTGTASRASLDIAFASAIYDGNCAQNTASWAAVAAGDVLTVGWPGALNTGLSGTMLATANGTVAVRLCNYSGASVTPGTLTYKAELRTYSLTGSSTIDFGAVYDGSCASSTFALAGAVAGDHLAAGWPSTLETGLTGTMLVSATDTVQIRLCNSSGATLDPGSHLYKASISS